MERMSYVQRDYAARLEKYIADEACTKALYAALSGRSSGSTAAALREMSGDEDRHLRAMQLEYYLLTGDSLYTGRQETEGDMTELLRLAYAGEGAAAEEYCREAGMHSEKALKELFLAQSEDERRHRAKLRKMLKAMLGM